MTLDLTTKTSTELAELLSTIPVSEWNAAVAAARAKDRLWRANLNGANLYWASLDGARLDEASLDGASLYRASLNRANLYRASLDGANLAGANLNRASLDGANLDGANLNRASLDGANLDGASLYRANLNEASLDGANLNGEPLTVDQWCDIFDMPIVGKGLRVGFKRLPADRITGRNKNKGKHLVEWKPGRWVEAPDWTDTAECGGGLHLSPTAAMTRTYSSKELVIAVAFDPADAVLLGDKLKVRKAKVIG